MLRNIGNFIKYDISPTAKKAVIEKLSNADEVKKSKQLPFRFHTAWSMVNDRVYLEAISAAAEHAVANVPVFDGKTLIAVDGSGSMSGDPIQKASLFAASLIKANKNADLVLYDTEIRATPKNIAVGASPVLRIADDIASCAVGGGTRTNKVFEFADGKKYDTIVILSDNEAWGNCTQGAYNAMKVKPEVFAIDIQGYGTTDLKAGKRVHHVIGWSDKMFDVITTIQRGGTLVDEIENMML